VTQELRDEIELTSVCISAALWGGDMDLARTLVSRKIGLKIVAGDIVVKLKKPKYP
jgi:hypothetical protein